MLIVGTLAIPATLLALTALAEEALPSAEPGAGSSVGVAGRPWVRLERAELERYDAPLVYHPAMGRFMVLGGSIGWDRYPQPHPFDELALDLTGGQWENWIPSSKNWGPRFGNGKAPGWKNESWGLVDAEGNCRPNVTTYRGLWLYNQYAFDPDSQRVYFSYFFDPAQGRWSRAEQGSPFRDNMYVTTLCNTPQGVVA
jgi:hypothetical protein